MSSKFIRNIEDFTCEHCGAEVKGTGYTNHCPKCLWSKHVDIHPGDRAAKCGGMMKPVDFERGGDEYVLTHKCLICGYEKRNILEEGDNFDLALTSIRDHGPK
ncbi:RNHCP domain-containing protein [Candidatus Parcubacteria bacterium]|nr:RNHCP domain-containing protein [Candidatus Parcubacteria bacterium]